MPRIRRGLRAPLAFLAAGALMLAAALMLGGRTTTTDDAADVEAEIRAQRARFNDAIVARDTSALAAIWAADVRVITSAGGRIDGRDAYRQRFASYFAERREYAYRREPTRVEVFEPWGIATEYGNWRGSWIADDGRIEVGGEYAMQWTRTEEGWRVGAELFAPEYCHGGKYCSERP